MEGCSCPEGETLSETGDCIPVSSCPCPLGEGEGEVLYTAGSQDYRPQSGEVCSCINARWICQSANTTQLSQMSTSASPVWGCRDWTSFLRHPARAVAAALFSDINNVSSMVQLGEPPASDLI